ncbi:MAG: ATP-binding protein [Phycisphaerales bacterium]
MADSAAHASWFVPFLVAAGVAAATSAALVASFLHARGERRRLAAALDARAPADADPLRLARESAQLRKRLARALAQSRAIVDRAPVGIVAVDPLGRIVSINSAAVRLLQADAATRVPEGRLLIELARSPQLEQLLATARGTDERADAELAFESAAGTRIARCSVVPLEHDGGAPACVLVMEDLTELRRLEAVRTEFVANVSHELRTPVTTIRGYAETLTDGFELDPQAARFVQTINRSAARLARVIDDLLLLSSLEDPAARHEATAAPVSVPAILREAAEQHAPAAEAKRVALAVECPAGLRVRGNAGLLAQAAGNLVSNAVKYAPEGTAVRIAARREGDEVHLTVRDEGPGIAEHHQARLFERFYRVDRARARDSGGTGLGLAIVKHVALVHGGTVEVESQAGRGSTFRIRLPAPDEPAAPVSLAAPAAADPRS